MRQAVTTAILRKMIPACMALAFVVPANALAGSGFLSDSEHDFGRKAKKKAVKAKGKDDKKAFEDVVKGMDKKDGLFNLYWDDAKQKAYMEIRPDQVGKIYLCSPTVSRGLGRYIIGGAVWNEFPFYFQRVGDRIQLTVRNVWYRADASEPAKRAIANSFSDSVLATAKIISDPHPETKGVLVDAGDFFLTDLGDTSQYLKEIFKAGHSLSESTSYLESVQAFPLNVEIDVNLNYTSDKSAANAMIPDTRSIQIGLTFSLSSILETGYRPRVADDRIGHFQTLFQDFSDARSDTPYVRYVQRWHLEKQDPTAEVSPPKKPIVFWLENTIPDEYRPAIMEGVLLWNDAFKRIGFSNAIVVKQQPDDADWDAADVRYSTIRWIVAPGAAFAQGPSRVNPFTGEIFDADIRIMEEFTRYTWRQFAEKIEPILTPAAPSAFNQGPSLQHSDACMLQYGMARQAAFASGILESRGLMARDDVLSRKFVREMLISTICHEVGHTLGLRHNYKGSTYLANEKLHDEKYTLRNGLTNSVMEYAPVNIAPEGVEQGEYWQTSLGPYDYWAIEYAYKQIPAENEREELAKIAGRCTEPELAYGTDFDALGGWTKAIDPEAAQWDLGKDSIAFHSERLKVAQELWSKMLAHFEQDGERYPRLRRVFSMSMGEFALAARNVSRFVGGIYHYKDHVGDPGGRTPLRPVPARRQREALGFLTTKILGQDAFQFEPGLLNRLAPEIRPDFEGGPSNHATYDYPIHDRILGIQSMTLDRLYDGYTLKRIVDCSVKAEDGEPFSLDDLFTGVRNAVWEELGKGEPINSFRRNLQREHSTRLAELVLKQDAAVPGDAVSLARRDLKAISGLIEKAGSRGVYRKDAMTAAHLEEIQAKISAALESRMVKPL